MDDEQAKPEPEATGDDAIVVTLSKPIPVFDEKITTLSFRRPLAADIFACGGIPVIFDPVSSPPRIKHNAVRMTAMMARLSGVPSSSLGRLGPSEWVFAAWKLSEFFIPMSNQGEEGVVTLSEPITVSDEKGGEKIVATMRFRSPTAADIIQVGNPVSYSPALMAPPEIDFHVGSMMTIMVRLSGIPIEAIATMQARDWVTCAWELSPFFIPPTGQSPSATI
jgi:hypothetical protein